MSFDNNITMDTVQGAMESYQTRSPRSSGDHQPVTPPKNVRTAGKAKREQRRGKARKPSTRRPSTPMGFSSSSERLNRKSRLGYRLYHRTDLLILDTLTNLVRGIEQLAHNSNMHALNGNQAAVQAQEGGPQGEATPVRSAIEGVTNFINRDVLPIVNNPLIGITSLPTWVSQYAKTVTDVLSTAANEFIGESGQLDDPIDLPAVVMNQDAMTMQRPSDIAMQFLNFHGSKDAAHERDMWAQVVIPFVERLEELRSHVYEQGRPTTVALFNTIFPENLVNFLEAITRHGAVKETVFPEQMNANDMYTIMQSLEAMTHKLIADPSFAAFKTLLPTLTRVKDTMARYAKTPAATAFRNEKWLYSLYHRYMSESYRSKNSFKNFLMHLSSMADPSKVPNRPDKTEPWVIDAFAEAHNKLYTLQNDLISDTKQREEMRNIIMSMQNLRSMMDSSTLATLNQRGPVFVAQGPSHRFKVEWAPGKATHFVDKPHNSLGEPGSWSHDLEVLVDDVLSFDWITEGLWGMFDSWWHGVDTEKQFEEKLVSTAAKVSTDRATAIKDGVSASNFDSATEVMRVLKKLNQKIPSIVTDRRKLNDLVRLVRKRRTSDAVVNRRRSTEAAAHNKKMHASNGNMSGMAEPTQNPALGDMMLASLNKIMDETPVVTENTPTTKESASNDVNKDVTVLSDMKKEAQEELDLTLNNNINTMMPEPKYNCPESIQDLVSQLAAYMDPAWKPLTTASSLARAVSLYVNGAPNMQHKYNTTTIAKAGAFCSNWTSTHRQKDAAAYHSMRVFDIITEGNNRAVPVTMSAVLSNLDNAMKTGDTSGLSLIVRINTNLTAGDALQAALASGLSNKIASGMMGGASTVLAKIFLYCLQSTPLFGPEYGLGGIVNHIPNAALALHTKVDWGTPNQANLFPLSGDAANAIINAVVITGAQYSYYKYGNLQFDPAIEATHGIGTWGVTTAVVPVTQELLNRPEQLAWWTLCFMEYPARTYTFAGNTTTVLGANLEANREHTSMASMTVITGVRLNVLYVLTQFNNPVGGEVTFDVGTNASHVNVSSFTNSALVGGAVVNIYTGLLAVTDLPDIQPYLTQLINIWERTYGGDADYKTALMIASSAFTMPLPFSSQRGWGYNSLGAAGKMAFTAVADTIYYTATQFANTGTYTTAQQALADTAKWGGMKSWTIFPVAEDAVLDDGGSKQGAMLLPTPDADYYVYAAMGVLSAKTRVVPNSLAMYASDVAMRCRYVDRAMTMIVDTLLHNSGLSVGELLSDDNQLTALVQPVWNTVQDEVQNVLDIVNARMMTINYNSRVQATEKASWLVYTTGGPGIVLGWGQAKALWNRVPAHIEQQVKGKLRIQDNSYFTCPNKKYARVNYEGVNMVAKESIPMPEEQDDWYYQWCFVNTTMEDPVNMPPSVFNVPLQLAEMSGSQLLTQNWLRHGAESSMNVILSMSDWVTAGAPSYNSCKWGDTPIQSGCITFNMLTNNDTYLLLTMALFQSLVKQSAWITERHILRMSSMLQDNILAVTNDNSNYYARMMGKFRSSKRSVAADVDKA